MRAASEVYNRGGAYNTANLPQPALDKRWRQFGNRRGCDNAGVFAHSNKDNQHARKYLDQHNDHQPRLERLLARFVPQYLLAHQCAEAAAGQSQHQQCLFRNASPAKPSPPFVAPELDECDEVQGGEIKGETGFGGIWHIVAVIRN